MCARVKCRMPEGSERAHLVKGPLVLQALAVLRATARDGCMRRSALAAHAPSGRLPAVLARLDIPQVQSIMSRTFVAACFMKLPVSAATPRQICIPAFTHADVILHSSYASITAHDAR